MAGQVFLEEKGCPDGRDDPRGVAWPGLSLALAIFAGLAWARVGGGVSRAILSGCRHATEAERESYPTCELASFGVILQPSPTKRGQTLHYGSSPR